MQPDPRFLESLPPVHAVWISNISAIPGGCAGMTFLARERLHGMTRRFNAPSCASYLWSFPRRRESSSIADLGNVK